MGRNDYFWQQNKVTGSLNAPPLKGNNGSTPTEGLEHQLNNKNNGPKPANEIFFTLTQLTFSLPRSHSHHGP
jgi:hypothetical protein